MHKTVKIGVGACVRMGTCARMYIRLGQYGTKLINRLCNTYFW